MNKYVKSKYEKQGVLIVKALKKRNFEAYYVSTAEEATSLFFSLISVNSLISWGGSETIKEIKLIEEIKKRNYNYLDRDSAENSEERQAIMRKSLLSDVYIMSCNAISSDGCLINIDGIGNRVSALCFGPKIIVIFAGMNKITKDVNTGILRSREVAATTNVCRFENEKSYCSKTGMCNNCIGSNTICSQILITRYSKIPERIKVILIGEDLGF